MVELLGSVVGKLYYYCKQMDMDMDMDIDMDKCYYHTR
jgi:hypothetical protein